MSVRAEPSAIGSMPASSGHDALAADGRIVRIRPVASRDADALRLLYTHAGERSLYLRFFTAGHGQIDDEVRRLTRPPAADHLALVALDGDALVGVASYERTDRRSQAEFAVLVADAQHGRGIGTLLLEDLAGCARAAGIAELVGDVLPANAAMLRVSRGLAPGVPSTFDSGVVVVRVPTAADEAALAAVDLRERAAERHALQPLLAPASVAVVGAGRDPGGV